MVSASLTNHDLFILEKIKDPESGPSVPVLIDSSLPRDPHITNDATYQKITQSERAIISLIHDVELQIAKLKPAAADSPLSQYLSCVKRLDELIEEYPSYASTRNNRAQALRRIYGDGVLAKGNEERSADEATPLDVEASEDELIAASKTILDDLSTAISLLTPAASFMAISCKLFSSFFWNKYLLWLRLISVPQCFWDIHNSTSFISIQTFKLIPPSTISKNPLTSLHAKRRNLPPIRQAPFPKRHRTENSFGQGRGQMVSS
jgi:hypothetical protein